MTYSCIMATDGDKTILIERFNERLILDARAILYWKRKRWLVISDLHLGKSAHFRKQGMAVPNSMDAKDLDIVKDLIAEYNPLKVILLGDLFHSDYNLSWERLAEFTNQYKAGLFTLVRGNHDVVDDWHYGRTLLEVVDEIKADPFWFTHIPEEDTGDFINVCGHLHPGIKLYGKGRQSLRLPAFYIRKKHILMPAFGTFTGTMTIKPRKSDQVIGLVESTVVRIQ